MFRPVQLIFFALAMALILALGCGGSSEYAMVGTARAAGTDGTVQVETIEGGNRLVTLSLEHLPPPDRLGDDMTVYVVWFIGEDAPATKAGVLAYDADSRQGTLTATTPLEAFTVRVTAEVDRNAGSPSDIVVAERQVGG